MKQIWKASFLLAGVDIVLSFLSAAAGSRLFLFFWVLGLLMWVHGSYYKNLAEKEGE